MIFAREVSDPLTSLVKKIDVATGKHSSCSMGSFVVFLNDDDGLDKQLKEVAKKEDLTHTVLTIDNPTGPGGYKIAKEADVTVVLYSQKNAKANFAYRKGELNQKEIDKILGDLGKILPQDKK